MQREIPAEPCRFTQAGYNDPTLKYSGQNVVVPAVSGSHLEMESLLFLL